MELGQPLLPPVAGYAYTLAARRLGLEYLTFQFYLWKGALFHKIGDFLDISLGAYWLERKIMSIMLIEFI